VLAVYFRIHHALSRDNAKVAGEESANLLEALEAVDMALLAHEAHMAWMKALQALKKTGEAMGKTQNIVELREQFHILSDTLAVVVKRFGSGGTQAVLQYHCPMAFNERGALWLQSKEGVENPYFGSTMFGCGEQIATLAPLKE